MYGPDDVKDMDVTDAHIANLLSTEPLDIQSHAACGSLPPLPAQPPSHSVKEARCHVEKQVTSPPPAFLLTRPTFHVTDAVTSESLASAYPGLLRSLMAQGLILLPPTVSSQDSVGIEFDKNFLKVRHEPSIKAPYYDLSRQCATCGLRFRSQESHSTHMDWHVTRNRIAKKCRKKLSRHWYASVKQWQSGAEIIGINVLPNFFLTEEVQEEREVREAVVAADENRKLCALCRKPFEDFFCEEMEEWMYKDAVERSQLGAIVHTKCRPESTDHPGKSRCRSRCQCYTTCCTSSPQTKHSN